MFLHVCKQTFRISRVRISQKVIVGIMYNVRDAIFYMKTNVLQDFHVWISIPVKDFEGNCLILKTRIYFGYICYTVLGTLQYSIFFIVVLYYADDNNDVSSKKLGKHKLNNNSQVITHFLQHSSFWKTGLRSKSFFLSTTSMKNWIWGARVLYKSP